jgi:hypothetical protein
VSDNVEKRFETYIYIYIYILNKFRFCELVSFVDLEEVKCMPLQHLFAELLSVLHDFRLPPQSTMIPRLTKIIRSGITFVSRNFVSRNTHTDGKDKPLEWPDRSSLLLYVSARIH